MSTLLTWMIDQQEESMNTLIKRCGIDRSTFFQIRREERVPTEKNFCDIVRQLAITDEQKRMLIEEFEEQRYWRGQDQQELRIARLFLQYLNNHSCYIDDVDEAKNSEGEHRPLPEEILNFIRKERKNSENGRISCYIPAELLDRYDIYQLFPILNEQKKKWRLDLLLSAHNDTVYDPVRKLKHIRMYFDMIEQTECAINVFRDVCTAGSPGMEPWPYWILGTGQMILIDGKLEKYVLLQLEEIVSGYDRIFEIRMAKAYQILKRYPSLYEMIKEMDEKCRETLNHHNRLYVMSAVPCTVLAVTEQQIREYCDGMLADFLCEYRQSISEAVTCEFITTEGYSYMKNNRVIPEWDMDLTYTEQDFEIVNRNLQERFDKKQLFFLDAGSQLVPKNYSIVLFEGMEINIQSLFQKDVVIQIRQKELVNALEKWFHYRDKIAWIEEEVGLIEG